jgi:hypothetical protein
MEQHNHKRGAKRLLQILISEAAHLIWVLRCERVIVDDSDENQAEEQIPRRTHTNTEIKSRWLKAINTRLIEDKITATKVKRDKTSTLKVKETWELLLKKSAELPHNWVHNREVLVGRRT